MAETDKLHLVQLADTSGGSGAHAMVLILWRSTSSHCAVRLSLPLFSITPGDRQCSVCTIYPSPVF